MDTSTSVVITLRTPAMRKFSSAFQSKYKRFHFLPPIFNASSVTREFHITSLLLQPPVTVIKAYVANAFQQLESQGLELVVYKRISLFKIILHWNGILTEAAGQIRWIGL